jgi:DNA-binding SARP family transcriptional activator
MQVWEWFAPVERRIQDLAQSIRCMLADEILRIGDPAASFALARAAIEADEFDERARTLAIRALLAGGDQAAGVREYRRYRDFLRDELDIEPPAALRHLLEDAADYATVESTAT